MVLRSVATKQLHGRTSRRPVDQYPKLPGPAGQNFVPEILNREVYDDVIDQRRDRRCVGPACSQGGGPAGEGQDPYELMFKDPARWI